MHRILCLDIPYVFRVDLLDLQLHKFDEALFFFSVKKCNVLFSFGEDPQYVLEKSN